jgi:hypothetical protein
MATQSLEFKSDLDDTQFQAGLKNMEKGGKRVEGSLVGSFSSMAKSIGSSMAAAFTVQAVVGAAKSLLDFVGQLQDQAEALGVSTEKLQGLQGAMSQSGVSAEKFTKGMATLNQSIDQAKNDTGTARDSFEALGITFANIANDSPDELILKIADGLKNAKDPAAAFAAALDLLGKNNINFVAGLKGGRDEVDKLANSIEKISKEDVALLAAAGDSIEQFGTKVKVSAINGALGLLKYKEQIKSIGLIAAVATGQLEPFLKVIAAAEGFFGDSKGTPSPATNEPKPEYFGPEYTPPAPVVEDPRETKRLKDLKEFYAETEKYEREKQQDIASYEKDKLDDLKKFYAETERYEMEKQQDIAAYQKEQAKELQKQAFKKDIKQAEKTLQQAQKDTSKAEDKTKDAKSSLERALLGNPDRKPNKLERQVKRMMDDIEKGKPVAKSSRRGTGKALEEFKRAKDAEKAAKDAEKKAEQQQEKMVTALEEINKGINGK